MVSQYWYFNDGFNFQDSICNSCRDLATLSVNVSDNNIITVKNVGYCCIIHNISKSEQLIYQKILCLKIVGMYKNAYPQIEF